MGTRDKSDGVDFSGILEQEVEDALKAAAQISMGTEISEEDLSNIIALCDQVRACVRLCVCSRQNMAMEVAGITGVVGVETGMHACVCAERTAGLRCACLPRQIGGKRDLRVPAQCAEVFLSCCRSPC